MRCLQQMSWFEVPRSWLSTRIFIVRPRGAQQNEQRLMIRLVSAFKETLLHDDTNGGSSFRRQCHRISSDMVANTVANTVSHASAMCDPVATQLAWSSQRCRKQGRSPVMCHGNSTPQQEVAARVVDAPPSSCCFCTSSLKFSSSTSSSGTCRNIVSAKTRSSHKIFRLDLTRAAP